MKSLYTLTFAFLLLGNTLFGQLAYKSIAPDFTAKDLNGVEHNLYDLLDDGKIVILDIFATWCGPCWNYHNQHILADIYDQYGPAGTDEIYVFAIEGDPSTNVTCLTTSNGCNSSTFGDWTAGVPYPIMDNAQIADDYGISYYPTIYMVYPNKKVQEIGQGNTARVLDFASQSESLVQGSNPVVLYSRNENGSVCSNQWPSRPHFLISNMGTEIVTSMDIEVSENGQVIYNTPWTGSANPYEIIIDLTLPVTIVDENTTYQLKMKNINGDASQEVIYNSYLTLDVDNLIYVTIETDADAASDANRFEIKDKNGDIVASETINKANTLYEFTYVMENKGCHTLTIYDEGGNGIDGKLSVVDAQGNVIYVKKDFGETDVQKFSVSILSDSKDVILDEVSISPNPVNDYLYINANNNDVKFEIIDISGRIMISQGDVRNTTIDVSTLQPGMYLVRLEREGNITTKKIIKL